MKLNCKGISLGNILITTKKSLENSKIEIDVAEIDLLNEIRKGKQ